MAIAAPVFSCLFVLFFFPQAVLSKFNSISFSSIQQCGPFNVTFSGGSAPDALPLSLTVIPFNSTSLISIQIPVDAWNAQTQTGAAITFLPLAAGQTFVASLEDANGNPTGSNSDIILIKDSDDSSCLPSGGTNSSTPLFNMPTQVSQCDDFTVTYSDKSITAAPSVRAFVPFGFTFPVNESVQAQRGSATYTMDAFRGLQVALVADDGNGNKQSSALMTVGGDSSSSKQCLKAFTDSTFASSTPKSDAVKKSSLSSGALIAIGIATGSVVGTLAILSALYVYRERRKRERNRFQKLEQGLNSNGGVSEKRFTLPSQPPTPLYNRTQAAYTAPYFQDRASAASLQGYKPSQSYVGRSVDWGRPTTRAPSIAPSLGSTGSLGQDPIERRRTAGSGRRPSVQTLRSLDIEKILERATVYSQGETIGPSQPRPQVPTVLVRPTPRAIGSQEDTDLPVTPAPRTTSTAVTYPYLSRSFQSSSGGGSGLADVPASPTPTTPTDQRDTRAQYAEDEGLAPPQRWVLRPPPAVAGDPRARRSRTPSQ